MADHLIDPGAPLVRRGAQASQLSFLDLFFILLTLFVLLIALSTFDIKRVSAIIHSVQFTFNPTVNLEIQEVNIIRLNRTGTTAGRVLQDVISVLKTEIEAVEISADLANNHLVARFPANALFEKDGIIFRQDQVTVLERIANSLSVSPYRIRTSVLASYRNLDDAGENPSDAVFRAALLAELFNDAGIPVEDLYTGIADDKLDTITFEFEISDRRLPQVDFAPQILRAEPQP